MPQPYTGPLSPATAMSAVEPAFREAHVKAVATITEALKAFERTTGRVVAGIELRKLDVTTINDEAPRFVQQVVVDFLPIPAEVAWS
jgi:hypothetical protein